MLERLLARARERRSISIAHHGIGPSVAAWDPHFLRVPEDAFRRQLELVLGAGFEIVAVSELADRAAGGPPPPGLCALSFDDGLEDNLTTALPILREYGAGATVYVMTGYLGKPNPWLDPAAGQRIMAADEVAELAAAGVEIGAHTVTHPDLSQLDRDACLREMTDSRAELEHIVGAPVRTFAYPFCSYGPATVEAARVAGFDSAVTCAGRGSWAPYEMKRALITGKDGLPSFVAKALDAYQPLFESPPVHLARFATRGLRRHARAAMERRR